MCEGELQRNELLTLSICQRIQTALTRAWWQSSHHPSSPLTKPPSNSATKSAELRTSRIKRTNSLWWMPLLMPSTVSYSSRRRIISGEPAGCCCLDPVPLQSQSSGPATPVFLCCHIFGLPLPRQHPRLWSLAVLAEYGHYEWLIYFGPNPEPNYRNQAVQADTSNGADCFLRQSARKRWQERGKNRYRSGSLQAHRSQLIQLREQVLDPGSEATAWQRSVLRHCRDRWSRRTICPDSGWFQRSTASFPSDSGPSPLSAPKLAASERNFFRGRGSFLSASHSTRPNFSFSFENNLKKMHIVVRFWSSLTWTFQRSTTREVSHQSDSLVWELRSDRLTWANWPRPSLPASSRITSCLCKASFWPVPLISSNSWRTSNSWMAESRQKLLPWSIRPTAEKTDSTRPSNSPRTCWQTSNSCKRRICWPNSLKILPQIAVSLSTDPKTPWEY